MLRLLDRSVVDDALWEEIEQILISADVGVNATDELINRVKERVKEQHLREGAEIHSIMKEEMVSILDLCLEANSSDKEDLSVFLVVGANGVGKTTSIAKLAHNYRKQGKSVVLAAGDTFRAAAIDQLKIWGQRLGVDVISHQPGGDPGAVVYDAVNAAISRQIQVLIVDTAGRLHTKFNLMEELKKIKRIVDRAEKVDQQVLLVLDATTGQNGLAQAKYFTDAVGVSGIILAKLDGTARGGIVLAICKELKIPILFLGTGQDLDDLVPFNAGEFVEALFS